jgi:hypothetical protein
MGKHTNFQKPTEDPRKEIHPVWRGIGLVIVIITPIISWAAASLTLEYGKMHGWPLAELSDYVRFPEIVYQIPVIQLLANYLSSIPYIKALALFFVLMLIFFSGIFAVINALVYRVIGPPRYTHLDVPAPRVKTKRYTR